MKTAKARRSGASRPKHKHTKEYLKHYHPFLPMLVSIAALLMIMLSSFGVVGKQGVLAYATNMNHQALLDATNEQRDKVGANRLALNDTLSRAAQAKAEDMVKRNYWSHNTPEGAEPWAFINSSGYRYQKAGENLAFGFNNNTDVVAGWMNSQTHRENMLDRTFSEAGFGWANSPDFNQSGPATVTVAMYATPESAVLTQEKGQAEPQVLGTGKDISAIHLLTKVSWSVYVIAIILGAATMYIVHSHTVAVHRMVSKSEKFIIKHPLFDTMIVLLAIACFLLLRAVGSVL